MILTPKVIYQYKGEDMTGAIIRADVENAIGRMIDDVVGCETNPVKIKLAIHEMLCDIHTREKVAELLTVCIETDAGELTNVLDHE